MDKPGESRVGLLRLTGFEAVGAESMEEKEEEKKEEEQEKTEPLSDLTQLHPPARNTISPDQLQLQLPPGPQFPRFTELPHELRERVYTHALTTGNPILPHLCDRNGKQGGPKFHDDNAVFHHLVAALLGVTRVSRKIRSESLPVFYAANAFAVGPDTVTYFAYLQRVGRFDMVRRVVLSVSFEGAKYAAWVLRCVDQVDREVEQYEESSLAPSLDADASSAGKVTARKPPCSAEELRSHPRYQVGGASALNLALLLRMLSTTASPNTTFTSRIVLPVTCPSVFHDYPGLRWFPSLVEGLGMELRFAVRPATARLDNHMLEVEWHRRFQGNEYAEQTVAATSGAADGYVLERALHMYPDLEEMPRPEKICYYRRACGARDVITWYDMQTLGGGRW